MSDRPGRRYKRYLQDPGVSMPKRTRIRRIQAFSRQQAAEELETEIHVSHNSDPVIESDQTESDQTEADRVVPEPQLAYGIPENFSNDMTSPTNNDAVDLETHPPDQADIPIELPLNDGHVLVDSSINRKESLLLLEAFTLRHKLTATAFEDLLRLFNTHFPGSVPGSKHLFDKEFSSHRDELEKHVFCGSCFGYIGLEGTSCPDCDEAIDIETSLKRGNYFIVLPLRQQFVDLLQAKSLYEKLQFPSASTADVYCDITDGEEYQRLLNTGHIRERDLTFIWNCDGVPVFRSSNYAIWPIQCTVNELPINMRKKNILLTGIWFGPHKPRMDTFLNPFVAECRQLCSDGFSWVNPITETTELSHVHMLVCTADAIARPTLQNTKQFNGMHGCDWCLHPGVSVERGKGSARVYPFTVPEPTLRTEESHRASALEAIRTNIPDNGVKGPSILMLVPCFGIIAGFVPDYMHSVLLGVTRQLVLMWLQGTGKDWYIGNQKDDIDRKILALTPPNEMTRRPRSLHLVKYWKASEWRSFLLYYGLLVMKGFLPNKYLAHFFLLAHSIRALVSTRVTLNDVHLAGLCLNKFVLRTEQLYGLEYITFNIHQLTHVADSVRSWGPLFATSAFVFEGNNGFLLNQFSGTQYVPTQICGAALLWHDMKHKDLARQQSSSAPAVDALMEKLVHGTKGRKRVSNLDDHVTALGPPCLKKLPATHSIALDRLFGHRMVRECESYSRFILDKLYLSTSTYTRATSRNNSVVQLSDDSFMQLEELVAMKPISCSCTMTCACDKQPVILGRELIPYGHCLYRDRDLPVQSDFMFTVRLSNCIKAIRPSAIKCKAIFFHVDGRYFVTSLPNPYEYD